jgi:hypothetical protein
MFNRSLTFVREVERLFECYNRGLMGNKFINEIMICILVIYGIIAEIVFSKGHNLVFGSG